MQIYTILIIVLIIILWGSILIQTHTISNLERRLDQFKEAYYDCYDSYMQIASAYKKDIEKWKKISEDYQDLLERLETEGKDEANQE